MYRNQKVAREKKSYDEQAMILETLKRGGASDLGWEIENCLNVLTGENLNYSAS